ncbi:unnamed protein product, partial [Mesorhabditis belari]|uniref:CUE domain-containing protein n=1 Tax=Mesorhabditis belari TaxID=2138241 RepID=A0AAF3EAB3_9BILA
MSQAGSENGLLEFETAMKDFQEMFPDFPRERIERALRANEGDVANTIDHLLAEGHNEPNSSSSPPAKPRPITQQRRAQSNDLSDTYAQAHSINESLLRNGAAQNFRHAPSTSHRAREPRLSVDEICRETAILRHKLNENEQKLDRVCDEREARILEDEQIALMLQNKEFVSYLKRDPEFVRDVFGNNRVPPNYNASIRKPNRNCYMPAQAMQPVPDGPVVDGLVINSKPGFAQKMKTKLNTMTKGHPPPVYTPHATTSADAYEQSVGADPFPHTVTLGYNQTNQDTEFKARLKDMSKSSKARLTQLASLFKKERHSSMDGPLVNQPYQRNRSSLDGPSIAPPPYQQRDYY